MNEESTTTVPIRQRSVVALDCETTGLRPDKGHNIIEVAMVKHNPDGSVEEFSTLIKPIKRISPSNQAIHGISPTMVREAPPFEDVYEKIQTFTHECVLIAHNAKFDMDFLQSEAKRVNLPLFSTKNVIDSLTLSRRFFGFPKNNLSVIAHRFHLMSPHAHRALPDARNTLHIFWAMLDDIEAREGTQLTVSQVQALCEKYHKQGAYKKNILNTITQANREQRRISIDYISKDPNKPIRTTRELEVTKWRKPYLEANCLLRGEPRRFHIKQIQRAEFTDLCVADNQTDSTTTEKSAYSDPEDVIFPVSSDS